MATRRRPRRDAPGLDDHSPKKQGNGLRPFPICSYLICSYLVTNRDICDIRDMSRMSVPRSALARCRCRVLLIPLVELQESKRKPRRVSLDNLD